MGNLYGSTEECRNTSVSLWDYETRRECVNVHMCDVYAGRSLAHVSELQYDICVW